MAVFPKWAAEEISKANFTYVETVKYSGYPLDIDSEKKRVDVQFYDRLPDGRYIATLDVPDAKLLDGVEKAEVYIFSVKVYEASLSDRLKKLLSEEYGVSIDKMYKFELESIERMD
ncbi:MAG: hypothetical protein QXW32_03850 [Nitrososphaerales archaeon]